MALKIGYIGGGAMAEALIAGALKSEAVTSQDVFAYDINTERLEALKKKYDINLCSSNNDLVNSADVVVLAVKPQVVGKVLPDLKSMWSNQVLISILAGTSISKLEKMIGENVPVVRVMPNTPALVGAGMSALCYNHNVTEEHLEIAKEIFKAVGEICVVEENLINAVTGLSGSGPAYVFLIIEALIDGGVKLGLPRELARKLAVQTLIGSAELVNQSQHHPAQLKDQVTSPGGTTIAALSILEQKGLRSALSDAVEASAIKAKELE